MLLVQPLFYKTILSKKDIKNKQMMRFPVTIYGDPLLRKKSKPVEKDHEGLTEIIDNMWETMYSADGAGLAAPQVGLSLRIFLADASSAADEDPELINFKKVFINPEIIEVFGEEWVMNEGCLSLPGIREDIKRPDKVRIRYQDENFNLHEDIFEGYPARIIQHEYDHLEGVLFIDHLSQLKKKLLKNKLKNIALGRVATDYQIKIPLKKA
jgi:peptide deformylase